MPPTMQMEGGTFLSNHVKCRKGIDKKNRKARASRSFTAL